MSEHNRTEIVGDREIVIALREEVVEVAIERRERTTRIDVVSTERTQRVAAELQHERAEITRVPVNRQVERTPDVREENGVTIIPIMEEILVVERRLMLKEEVHVRRMTHAVAFEQDVKLRAQDITVTQAEPGGVTEP